MALQIIRNFGNMYRPLDH